MAFTDLVSFLTLLQHYFQNSRTKGKVLEPKQWKQGSNEKDNG
jgi:hypothetical protein